MEWYASGIYNGTAIPVGFRAYHAYGVAYKACQAITGLSEPGSNVFYSCFGVRASDQSHAAVDHAPRPPTAGPALLLAR